MAGENETLRLSAAVATEPAFPVAFRGYERQEVEKYARTVEAQLAAALVANQELEAQIRNLTTQVRLAHDELGDLRRRPSVTDKLSYRHLGARVEQILAEAEQQADAVRQAAADDVARERAQLAGALNRAREAYERESRQANEDRERVLREIAEARAAYQADERETNRRLEAARAELIKARASAQRHRADAAQVLAAAQEAYDRLHASAMATAESVQASLATRAREMLTRAHEEAAAVARSAEAEAARALTEARTTAGPGGPPGNHRRVAATGGSPSRSSGRRSRRG